MRFDYRFSSRLYSQVITTNALRLLWILVILWGELGVYFWSLSSCRWPVHKTSGAGTLHALLITDTQVRAASIPSQSSSRFPDIRGHIVDRYLKKSWHVTSRLKPHVVFFLGDMLRDAKSVKNDAQYAELVQRFKSIFTLDTSTAIYHLPGNNDVGMGVLSSPTKNVRDYYRKSFGSFNKVVTLKNHTFLALDAPGLVDEDYQRNTRGVSFDDWEPVSGGAVEAVRRIADQHYHPLILLSHIPLYRPDAASCGPLREKGTIHRGVGHGYQNTLGKQTTAFLIQVLRPTMIFSGDNRDYCEYIHKGLSFGVEGSIPEITVKSFSPTPQIHHPGFQLLSIVDPTQMTFAQESLLHRPCILPDQSGIFTAYTWWIIATICVLLILNIQRIRHFRLTKPINHFLTPSPARSDPSPLLQDSANAQSPIWSPHTPFMPPKSPRPQMPSSFRTPMAPATPTFRASSRPMTPQGYDTPMPSPQFIPPHDEEDVMFPDQYAIQRDVRRPNDEEWTSIEREEFFDSSFQTAAIDEPRSHSSPSQFISAPRNMLTHHRRQSSWLPVWSKTFVWKGRRRRVVFRIPRLSSCWGGCKDIIEILRDADQRTLLRRRRGILVSTLIETFSVLWPAGIMWLIINFWMF